MVYTLSTMMITLGIFFFQAMNRQMIRIKIDFLSFHFQLMVNFGEQTNNNQKDFF